MMPADAVGQSIECNNWVAPKEYGKKYKTLLCNGYLLLKNNDLNGALSMFKEADKIKLFETPNVLLLPILAELEYKNGEFKSAKLHRKIAFLVGSVLLGDIRCVDLSNGIQLEDLSGKKIDTEASSEAVKRICGDAYKDLIIRKRKKTYRDQFFSNMISNHEMLFGSFDQFASRLYLEESKK